MSLDELIGQVLVRYEREHDRYLKLSARVAEVCRVEIVEGNAIRAHVTSRVKSPKSFADKIRKVARKHPEAVRSVDTVFESIRDLAGVRIATYDKELENKVVAAVRARFSGPSGAPVELERKDKHKNDPSNFYRATHCDVFLRPEELVGSYANLLDTPCEVQVCSLMAHVWNEVEHDIRYKLNSGKLSPTEEELLMSLGHLSRAGDAIISQLLAATDARLRHRSGPFEDVYDFVARVRTWFPSADFAIHAGQLFAELELLGLRSPEDLRAAIGDTTDLETRARRAGEARRIAPGAGARAPCARSVFVRPAPRALAAEARAEDRREPSTGAWHRWSSAHRVDGGAVRGAGGLTSMAAGG